MAAAAGLWLGVGTAAAQPSGAQQLVALFGRSCLQFAGETAAMRADLTARRIPPLPADAYAALLPDRPGRGFDASNVVTPMTVLSADDGNCLVLAAQAELSEAVARLEAVLTDNGLDYRPVEADCFLLRWRGRRFALGFGRLAGQPALALMPLPEQ